MRVYAHLDKLDERGHLSLSGASAGFRIVRMVGSGGSERSSRMDLRAIRNPELGSHPKRVVPLDKLDER